MHYYTNDIPPVTPPTTTGLVGIALTYAISMSWSLSACVNTFAETEKYMVAMERADDYVHNVPVESDQSTRVVSVW